MAKIKPFWMVGKCALKLERQSNIKNKLINVIILKYFNICIEHYLQNSLSAILQNKIFIDRIEHSPSKKTLNQRSRYNAKLHQPLCSYIKYTI